jgi:glycosyltransferase involved in cell wall biosynthesis
MDRKRIGIIYRGGKGWIGGVYYIQNIINALNLLPDEDKPLIDIYTESKDKFKDLRKITTYPYLFFNQYKENKFLKQFGKFSKFICYNFGKAISYATFNREDIFVYPMVDGNCKKILAWIPDFQEKYLPYLFNKKDLWRREHTNRYIATHFRHLVLSSHDSENDFKKFYPEFKCQIHVLHFAVTLPDYSQANIEDLKNKYGISGKYLFCPNQFWMHKNHAFLFRAYKKALDEGLNMQLICTGQLSDYRNPDYIQQLKDFISENHLESKIKVLGFISREDMLCLINNAHAVIQPSLFEGWSTVVEDAKAVNKFIFLSDIRVHREQIDKNVCFFNPHNEEDLCDKLLTVKPTHEPRDYQKSIKEFGFNFLDIINQFNS